MDLFKVSDEDVEVGIKIAFEDRKFLSNKDRELYNEFVREIPNNSPIVANLQVLSRATGKSEEKVKPTAPFLFRRHQFITAFLVFLGSVWSAKKGNFPSISYDQISQTKKKIEVPVIKLRIKNLSETLDNIIGEIVGKFELYESHERFYGLCACVLDGFSMKYVMENTTEEDLMEEVENILREANR